MSQAGGQAAGTEGRAGRGLRPLTTRNLDAAVPIRQERPNHPPSSSLRRQNSTEAPSLLPTLTISRAAPSDGLPACLLGNLRLRFSFSLFYIMK